MLSKKKRCKEPGAYTMSFDKFAISAITACVVATPAAAQEARRLDFGLSANVVHDTNIARSSDQLAALRGLKSADTIFTPAATFDLLIPVSRQTFFLNGLIGYDFYQENDQLNRERYSLNGGVAGQLGPCAPVLSGGYARSQSDLRDVTLLDPENAVETKKIDFNVSCVREPGFGANFSASQVWSDNSNPVQEQADYDTTSFGGGVSYGRPALGTFTIFTQRSETSYPNKSDLVASSSGYTSWNSGVSFERRIGARIQGDVSVSYSAVEMDSQGGIGSDDYGGIAYSGNLEYRATTRLTTRLEFSQQITPSIRVGSAYTVQQRTAFIADYKFGSRLSLEVGAENSDEEYRGDLATGLPRVALTDSEINTFYGALTYKPSDRLALRLSVERQERETNDPIYDYTSDRIGLKADVAF